MEKSFLTLVLMLAFGFVSARQNQTLQNGIWRGVLLRTDGKEIVFNFEVKDSLKKKTIFIINADERLVVDDIVEKGDSLFITLPFFDSQFRVANKGAKLAGNWIKHLADRDVVIAFEATHNVMYRFPPKNAASGINVSGKWTAAFTDTITGKVNNNIGVFEQEGNKLTGSFLTPYGDYRYLEGVVEGDSLKLSGFDGGYALLFTARIDSDATITGGRFYSGAGAAPQVWAAEKNNAAALPETASLLKPGVSSKVNFTFKDSDGKPVSLSDKKFRNKVVVLQITGTWCPNCVDETRFFNDVYEKYKSKGLEIVALAYERTEDFTRSQKAIKNFINRLNVKYSVLITPVAAGDPQKVEKTLPQLEQIPAFPTSIFLNRKGEIQKIHAGFSGPGTGEQEYKKQKEEYIHIIESLLSE